jgi:hypothetical protein
LAPWIPATVSASRSGSSRTRAMARVPDSLKPYSPTIASSQANDWV